MANVLPFLKENIDFDTSKRSCEPVLDLAFDVNTGIVERSGTFSALIDQLARAHTLSFPL